MNTSFCGNSSFATFRGVLVALISYGVNEATVSVGTGCVSCHEKWLELSVVRPIYVKSVSLWIGWLPKPEPYLTLPYLT